MKRKWLKGAFIGVGALALSTLGIFASDTIRGIDSRVSNLASIGNSGICQEGATPVRVDGDTLCVDIYEASPSTGCPLRELSSAVQSEQNANTKGCFAVSVEGARPWNYVSLPLAQRMCAEAGKRLPTSDEWYAYTLGTDTESCVIDETTFAKTGVSECVSSVGVHDAIGNLWEWVDANVVNGSFNGQPLPEEGYVESVDANGVALTSTTSPQSFYGEDYFWSKQEGVYGMIRGGFYGGGSDAGLYTINASVQTSLSTLGVGFRCVEDVI